MTTIPTKEGRVVLFGPGGVGKSTLMESGRWCEYLYEGSLEVSYRKVLAVDTVQVILDFWDSAGQEEYSAIRQLYLDRANVILLCFALNDRSTFDEALTQYLPEIRKVAQVVVILVGLKLDLIDPAATTSGSPLGTYVSFQEGTSAVIKNALYGYFQCSSKQYVGLDNLFEEVCRAGMFSDAKSVSKSTMVAKKSGFFSFFSKKSHNKPTHSTKPAHHITVDIAAATAVQSSLSVIPNCIWLLVMEYLDFVALIRVSRTCKLLYHLAKTEPIWTNAFRGVWIYPGCVKGLSWKNTTFTWDLAKCFQNYVPPPPRRRRSSSDDIVCFGPNTSILLFNNKYCPMKDLTVGDQVLAFYPTDGDNGGFLSSTIVHCIWKCPVRKPTPMIVISSKSATPPTTEPILEITPDHPILLLNGRFSRHSVVSQATNNPYKWCLPTSVGEPQMVDVELIDFIYYSLKSDGSPAGTTATIEYDSWFGTVQVRCHMTDVSFSQGYVTLVLSCAGSATTYQRKTHTTGDVEATLVCTTAVSLTNDWRIVCNPSVQVRWTHLEYGGYFQEQLEAWKNWIIEPWRIESWISEKLSQVPIRETLNRMWQHLNDAIQISTVELSNFKAEDVWLQLNPNALSVSPLTFSGVWMHVSIDLSCKPVIALGYKPASSSPVTGCPSFSSVISDRGIDAALAFHLPYTALHMEASRLLPFVIGPTGFYRAKITVKSVQLYSSGRMIVAAVDVDANKVSNATGVLDLWGELQWDSANRRLSVTDVDFHPETKKYIEGMFACTDWLLHDSRLKEFISRELNWNLGLQLEKLREHVSENHRSSSNADYSFGLHSFDVQSVVADDSGMIKSL
ncbi:Ras family [Pelomyxa schiedti]|nr:Ras family [Pelomyxa schiedti]